MSTGSNGLTLQTTMGHISTASSEAVRQHPSTIKGPLSNSAGDEACCLPCLPGDAGLAHRARVVLIQPLLQTSGRKMLLTF